MSFRRGKLTARTNEEVGDTRYTGRKPRSGSSIGTLQQDVEFQRKLYTLGALTGRVWRAIRLSDADYQEAVRRYKNMKVKGHERQRYHALILVPQG
jgi:hypothetical protein